MPGKEARLADTPYGRFVTSEGWFVLNLGEALAVRNEEKGGAASVSTDTAIPDDAYAYWPGDYQPQRRRGRPRISSEMEARSGCATAQGMTREVDDP